MNVPPSARETLPTRRQALAFSLKALLFRAQRSFQSLGREIPRALPRRPLEKSPVFAESRSLLYAERTPGEWALQAGKVHNVRLAARALHGRILPVGETFSFWANLGRASRSRGFVKGRELREGCVIPSIGGGLCQLSNALYDVALQAGAEIVERHAHSRRVPGSTAAAGRDATVFWNYVDLQFRAPVELQFAVELSGDELRVRLLSTARLPAGGIRSGELEDDAASASAESCETCGVTQCFRHHAASSLPRGSGTAWIVDAFQPEHDAWMKVHRQLHDTLLLPLHSDRWRLGAYRWTSSGFKNVRHAPWTTLCRSLASRRLSAQGAARQRALLTADAAMARALARRIPPLATHLVISQNLLPFLWQDGHLGGRTFDALMTRLPLRELESVLDRAARLHPQSVTFADFRAPSEIVDAEEAALAAAEEWITPHSAIAALAGPRASLLEWERPCATAAKRGEIVVFPASTLGRKGAYEMRAVARELRCTIRLVGPVLEDPAFWTGVPIAAPTGNWLEGAAAVVLPAWVEHQPRRLLQAVAAGVPTIASESCGLASVREVISIPTGNTERLCDALREILRATLRAK